METHTPMWPSPHKDNFRLGLAAVQPNISFLQGLLRIPIPELSLGAIDHAGR